MVQRNKQETAQLNSKGDNRCPGWLKVTQHHQSLVQGFKMTSSLHLATFWATHLVEGSVTVKRCLNAIPFMWSEVEPATDTGELVARDCEADVGSSTITRSLLLSSGAMDPVCCSLLMDIYGNTETAGYTTCYWQPVSLLLRVPPQHHWHWAANLHTVAIV